jgi:hypothetical protein
MIQPVICGSCVLLSGRRCFSELDLAQLTRPPEWLRNVGNGPRVPRQAIRKTRSIHWTALQHDDDIRITERFAQHSMTTPTRTTRIGSRKNLIERARRHATDLAPTINAIRAEGTTTLWGIAAELNRLGIPTAAGSGEWNSTQVRVMLRRLAGAPETDTSAASSRRRRQR